VVSLGPFLPLFATAAILFAGNGLQGTLIALRANEEGFSTSLIGLMGAAYFVGFMVSCLKTSQIIRAVGHIRAFAALAAVAAAGTLLLVLVIDPYAWIALRAAMGFCFAGLFMVLESWLNESVPNQDRGRVLSIYRVVDLTAVIAGQFLLPVVGTQGFTLFAIMAMLFCLSLVPVSLSNRSRPKPPEQFEFAIAKIWAISPLACLGCVTIGLTNSAFRLIGPLYGQEMGLDVAGIAFLMSAGILGGAVLQLPLGYLSDRFDRRWVLIACTGGAALAGLFLTFVSGGAPLALYAGAFAFGAFALPLYSLSAAHANDRADAGQYVLLAAGLTLFFSLGAAVGPIVASVVIEQLGAPMFFAYTSVIHFSLIFTALYRMARRPGVPRHRRSRFVMLLRTSPAIFRLARRAAQREPAATRKSRKTTAERRS
jgi:MFS family permease